MKIQRVFAEHWDDYELIDAGGGFKLERWGKIVTIRPEVQAYFKSALNRSEWNKRAHWEFVDKGGQKGEWKRLDPDAPKEWIIEFNELKFRLKLTQFKHLGIFPEQNLNWRLIADSLHAGDRFLNLFAYTGGASCVARSKNADVIHVDSVRQLISWASENMTLSGFNDIRWVHDDALKFVQRAVRREDQYELLIMDPPAWGIGAKNEKWKLENKIEELVSGASRLISKKGILVLNTYSPQVNSQLLNELSTKYLGRRTNELVELWMKSTSGKELYYGLLLRSYPNNAQ